MKTALRSLFVWLLLLALPWQGVASARMLPAVGGMAHASTAMARLHDGAPVPAHCALHMKQRMEAGAMEKAGHGGHAQGSHGGSSCPSCCIGVALAPAPAMPPALAPPDFIAVPFRAGHVTSVDPVLPERPPRPLSA